MSKADHRAAARLAAAQALYEMEVADKGLSDILTEFEAHWIGREVEGDQYNPAELAFFRADRSARRRRRRSLGGGR